MRRPLRIALVVVGLAAVVYGTASLTGGWLGTPPWWERVVHSETMPPIDFDKPLAAPEWIEGMRTIEVLPTPRPGREWISGGVVAVGLGLVAFGAWPRRSKPLLDMTPRPPKISTVLAAQIMLVGLFVTLTGVNWPVLLFWGGGIFAVGVLLFAYSRRRGPTHGVSPVGDAQAFPPR